MYVFIVNACRYEVFSLYFNNKSRFSTVKSVCLSRKSSILEQSVRILVISGAMIHSVPFIGCYVFKYFTFP